MTLSDDELIAVVERLVTLFEFEYVALSGGEPLLRRNLADVVSVVTARQLTSVLTTNGKIATYEKLAALHAGGLSAIQVPLLSAREATHDELSGGKSFEAAIRAIVAAVELGLSTTITFIETEQNRCDLRHVIQLASELGVLRVLVNELQVEGSAHLNRRALEIRELDEVKLGRPDLIAFGRSIDVEVRLIGAYEARQQDAPPWHRLALSPDGQLKLCNLSQKSVGYVSELSDLDLTELSRRLSFGDIAGLANKIDHCSCFASRYGQSVRPGC